MSWSDFENPAKQIIDALNDGTLTGTPEAVGAAKRLADLCANLGTNINAGADKARDLLEDAPEWIYEEDDRATAYVNLMAWSAAHDGDDDEVAAFNSSHGEECSGHPMRIMGYWPAVDDE